MTTPGTKVRLGPDWKWNDQDGNGIGTVMGPGKPVWVIVQWEHNDEQIQYRSGANNGKFDIDLMN